MRRFKLFVKAFNDFTNDLNDNKLNRGKWKQMQKAWDDLNEDACSVKPEAHTDIGTRVTRLSEMWSVGTDFPLAYPARLAFLTPCFCIDRHNGEAWSNF